ncbi:unnamed protein product [Lactuca saligna]|uniref:Uncharacterized protein n=1 Tax=Lactuca saligna TaxID=75948 RepID=A0AA35YUS2_LACSI|nr:unnamed protein product [Lactuca saligna]
MNGKLGGECGFINQSKLLAFNFLWVFIKYSLVRLRRSTSLPSAAAAADNQHSQIPIPKPPSNRSQLTRNFHPCSICSISHNHQIVIQYENFQSNPSFVKRTYLQIEFESSNQMALTNLILTVAGVSAVILLMRSDVKQSASIFKRNVRQIRHWLEEESASAAKEMEKAKPKELPKKDTPKSD